MHRCTHKETQACAHPRTRTHPRTHTHTRALTHTHTHTHTHRRGEERRGRLLCILSVSGCLLKRLFALCPLLLSQVSGSSVCVSAGSSSVCVCVGGVE